LRDVSLYLPVPLTGAISNQMIVEIREIMEFMKDVNQAFE